MRALALDDDRLLLQCHYTDREIAKSIPGRRWDPRRRCWVYPLQAYTAIRQAFPIIRVPAEVQKAALQAMEREAAFAETRAAGWEDAEPIEPMPVRTKPYKHQIYAFNLAMQLPHFAAFCEMGTGKTLVAIAAAGRRYLRGEVRRLLIICPASVMPVWRQEFEIHADFPHRVEVLDGPISRRRDTLAGWEDTDALQVAVLNYEGARAMAEDLIRWQPDMLICDEAHRLKTPGSKQSKQIARAAKKIRYRMVLTGTPITNNPLDIYGIYRTLDPRIFGTSFYAFRNRYALMGGYENRQVIGYQNLDELMAKIHEIAFRCRKEDCLDLPEMTDVYRYCTLEKSAQALYTQMARESVAELEAGETVIAANVLSKLLRLSQIAGGFLDGQPVSTAKLHLLGDILDDLDGQKAVIFVRFTAEKLAIEQLLAKRGVDFVSLDGSTPMRSRGELVQRFQADPDCGAFVGQIAAAGTGITLHAASVAIFYSCSFSYADLDQARSRLHRSGQRNPVTNIFLTCQDTVDEKILAALQQKRSVADQIVDSWRQYFNGKDDKHG